MTGARGHLDVSVNGVDDAADLVGVLGVELRLVEPVVGRKLHPDPLNEMQRRLRMRAVLRASAVEGGRKQRVDAHDVRVHRADLSEPVAVEVFVHGKLRGELPGKRDADVHALDEQGNPMPHLCGLRSSASRRETAPSGTPRARSGARSRRILECGRPRRRQRPPPVQARTAAASSAGTARENLAEEGIAGPARCVRR